MALRVGFLILILSLAMVAESSVSFDAMHHHLAAMGSGGGRVGDLIRDEEEMAMGSEVARRTLNEQRYISYGALKANNVPCDRRGRSYYNCNQRGPVNHYSRGCSLITHCGRVNTAG
ncbi:hypothetical protein NMG60_11012736 [Bertholletia excelsa]